MTDKMSLSFKLCYIMFVLLLFFKEKKVNCMIFFLWVCTRFSVVVKCGNN